ncbi:MAG: family NAD(P)-dependent oxidoreductase, partial [Klenkia sp.]|nr:family NAD(P)-dependent oxidoreductase [Klenkia sp.]
MQLGGAVALVTGGASGLGLATAERLLAEGAEVVLLDLPTSAGAEAAERLGRATTFVGADVRDPAGVASAVAAAVARGPLRVVVNCAGVGDPARTVGRDGPLDLARFSRVVEINLIGTF